MTCVPPPEHDGRLYHWVKHRLMAPEIAQWHGEGLWDGRNPLVGYDYLGPVLTPDEVTAEYRRGYHDGYNNAVDCL